MTINAALLEVRGLTAGYGQRTVISGIDLSVRRGEILALLGRNGAGKSTTLMAIAGFVRGAVGDVTVDGRPLTGPAYLRAREAISLVVKGRSLFPSLTVADNLELAGVQPDSVLELFPELAPRLKVKAGLLSGGEQQLLAVARALLRGQEIVLLDELTFGLSPAMASRVIDVVTAQTAARGLAVVAVEQHLHVAERLATHAIVLGEGRVRLSVTRAELLDIGPDIERVYLGRRSDTE
ncbi:ABC transporter ATP-binding protein [Rhodococcus globerulus]|uniref:ATP-binding cassette domain-containing protein n=1 Tax=Rhodococcus globerulus TaxID=33008 RepID=A0ABU4C429_RHOGO|nr:ATP-binding cassette domain-containing protein [Rhodococcus globerulus]MDV6270983.1 ATP-binding cassette domain-containing protein [Rhodococcus globerulus]